jgi:hypothetical protein
MINFSLALSTFTEYRIQLGVQINGGDYKTPDSLGIVTYPGVNRISEVRKCLDMATIKETSYVALRNMEYLLSDVMEIRFNAYIVRTELKALIKSPELNKDARYSNTVTELKNILVKVEDYLEIANKAYDYLLEQTFALTQINSTINKRFFNGEGYMYNYKEVDEN